MNKQENKESNKQTCSQRIAPSDYAGKHGPGTAAQRMGMGAIYSPSPASSTVPDPSVPEEVKRCLKGILMHLDGIAQEESRSVIRMACDEIRVKAEFSLSALRRLTVEDEGDSPEGLRVPASGLDSSGADVPPLGRVMQHCVTFRDAVDDPCQLSKYHGGVQIGFEAGPVVAFPSHTIPSLIAHLQAWLLTGSFSLPSVTQGDHPAGRESKALASAEPSSEDKELPDMAELEDWMVNLWQEIETVAGIATEFQPVYEAVTEMLDTFYSQRPTWIPGPKGHHDDNDPYIPRFQQASTTSQKGGQEA